MLHTRDAVDSNDDAGETAIDSETEIYSETEINVNTILTLMDNKEISDKNKIFIAKQKM